MNEKMISLNRIRFGGIFSNELNMPDLIMDCAFESDNSEINTFLTREAVASESYDGRTRRIASFKYTDNFAPKFTFLKKGFGDFTPEEVRALLKYLTYTDTTGLLEAYDDDSNIVSWASIGNFSDIQLYKIANKRTVGVTATWDSVSPFAFSDLYTVTKTIASLTDNKITINIDTDDNKPVYPRITIKHRGSVVRIPNGATLNTTSDMIENTVYFNDATYYWKSEAHSLCVGWLAPKYGWGEIVSVDAPYSRTDEIKENTVYYYTSDQKYRWIEPYYFKESIENPLLSTTSVKLTNIHTDFFNQSKSLTPTIVKNNSNTETVVLDGANRVISSSSVNRVFDTDFVDWNWLPLLDGKNEITVEGNCEVTFEWREVRKIGEY